MVNQVVAWSLRRYPVVLVDRRKLELQITRKMLLSKGSSCFASLIAWLNFIPFRGKEWTWNQSIFYVLKAGLKHTCCLQLFGNIWVSTIDAVKMLACKDSQWHHIHSQSGVDLKCAKPIPYISKNTRFFGAPFLHTFSAGLWIYDVELQRYLQLSRCVVRNSPGWPFLSL